MKVSVVLGRSTALLTTNTMHPCIHRRPRPTTQTPGPPTSLARTEAASVRGRCSLVTSIGMNRSPALPGAGDLLGVQEGWLANVT